MTPIVSHDTPKESLFCLVFGFAELFSAAFNQVISRAFSARDAFYRVQIQRVLQWLSDRPFALKKRWVSGVDRFLSNAVNKIDAKGRVSVPAQFRGILQTRGLSDLYALQNIDMAAIDAGGLDLLERYEARLESEDPLARSSDDISFFCHGDGAFLKVDTSGRITVTDFIREHTGIVDEVAFVGRGRFFQLWEPEQYRVHRSQVRTRLQAMREPSA